MQPFACLINCANNNAVPLSKGSISELRTMFVLSFELLSLHGKV